MSLEQPRKEMTNIGGGGEQVELDNTIMKTETVTTLPKIIKAGNTREDTLITQRTRFGKRKPRGDHIFRAATARIFPFAIFAKAIASTSRRAGCFLPTESSPAHHHHHRSLSIPTSGSQPCWDTAGCDSRVWIVIWVLGAV